MNPSRAPAGDRPFRLPRPDFRLLPQPNPAVLFFGDACVWAVTGRVSHRGYVGVHRVATAAYENLGEMLAPPRAAQMVRAAAEAVGRLTRHADGRPIRWSVVLPGWLQQVEPVARDLALPQPPARVTPEHLRTLLQLMRSDLQARGLLPLDLHVQHYLVDGGQLEDCRPEGESASYLGAGGTAVCLPWIMALEFLRSLDEEIRIDRLISPVAAQLALMGHGDRLPPLDRAATRLGLHVAARYSQIVATRFGRVTEIRILPLGAIGLLELAAGRARMDPLDLLDRLGAARDRLRAWRPVGLDPCELVARTALEALVPELPHPSAGVLPARLLLSWDGDGACLGLERLLGLLPEACLLQAPLLNADRESLIEADLLLPVGALRALNAACELAVPRPRPALAGSDPGLATFARRARRWAGGRWSRRRRAEDGTPEEPIRQPGGQRIAFPEPGSIAAAARGEMP